MAAAAEPASSSLFVQLVSEDGTRAGGEIDLPQSSTAQELEALVNQLLGQQDEPLP